MIEKMTLDQHIWILPPGFSGTCANRLTEAGLAAHGQLLAALSNSRRNQTDEAFSQFKNAWQWLPGNPLIANHYAAGSAPANSPRSDGGRLDFDSMQFLQSRRGICAWFD